MPLRCPRPGLPAPPRRLPLPAQSEAALREYFEGRTVTLKLAMPGTEDGVDIYPGTSAARLPPLRRPAQGHGTALQVRATRPGHQDQGEVQADRVPARRRRLRHDRRRDLSSVNVSRRAQDQAREEPRGRAQAGDRSRRRARHEGRAGRPQGGDASGRMHATARRWPRPQEQKKAEHPAAAARGRLALQHPLQGWGAGGGLTPEAIKEALAEYVEFDEPAPAPAEVASRCRWRDGPGRKAAGPAAFPPRACSWPRWTSCSGTPKRTSERMEGRLKVTTRVYPDRLRAR